MASSIKARHYIEISVILCLTHIALFRDSLDLLLQHQEFSILVRMANCGKLGVIQLWCQGCAAENRKKGYICLCQMYLRAQWAPCQVSWHYNSLKHRFENMSIKDWCLCPTFQEHSQMLQAVLLNIFSPKLKTCFSDELTLSSIMGLSCIFNSFEEHYIHRWIIATTAY